MLATSNIFVSTIAATASSNKNMNIDTIVVAIPNTITSSTGVKANVKAQKFYIAFASVTGTALMFIIGVLCGALSSTAIEHSVPLKLALLSFGVAALMLSHNFLQ